MMLWLAWWAQCQTSYEKSQDASEKIQKRVTFKDIMINDDLIRKIINILGKMINDTDMDLSNNIYSKLLANSLPFAFDKNGTIYIEADGAHLNTNKKVAGLSVATNNTKTQKDGERKESSWHEMKLGVVFTSDNITFRRNQKGEPYHIINKREYTATLLSVETFKKMLFSVAVKNGYGIYKQTVFISDGATWLSNMVKELFPKAIHILDLFHLKEKYFYFLKSILKMI
jgi:hypothetical protein